MCYIARSFVVFDQDIVYATAFVNYYNSNTNTNFQMQIFSEVDLVLPYLQQNRVAFLLVSQCYYDLIETEVSALEIPYAILVESKEVLQSSRHIYKFQAAKDIIKQIDQLMGSSIGVIEKKIELSTLGQRKIVSIIAPSSSLKSILFSLVTAQYLERQESTLFLNLDPVSCLETILFEGSSKGLSDILYFYKQGKTNVLHSQAFARRYENIIYIPKVEHYSDLFYMDEEDIDKIIKEAEELYSCKHIVILIKNIDKIMEYCIKKSTHVLIEQADNCEDIDNKYSELERMLRLSGLLQNKQLCDISSFPCNHVTKDTIKSQLSNNEELTSYVINLIENRTDEDI